MATPEGKIKQAILRALKGRMFWNNPTGVARSLDDPDRIIKFGLKGSADIIGIHPVTVTPEMVGQRIGQFAAIEVKVPGKHQRKDQKNFEMAVKRQGGIYIVARGVDDIAEITGGRR